MTQFPPKKVGYDGVAVHVYIWMEGTDADFVNGKSVENDDSQYNVTVKFAEKSPEYFYVFLSKSTIKNHISKSYIPVTHRTRQFKHSFSTICDNQSQGIFMKIEFPCL